MSVSYNLEYGTAQIEMHKDSIKPGQRVVKLCFVMELAGLCGRDRLKGYEIESVITYDGK